MAEEQTYTDRELRQRLKQEVQAGDKGGKPGQWSARKAQLLVQRYEGAGGGYVDDGHRTDAQRHLQQWGEQDWQTKDGDADAGGSRYLPEVAWKLLSKAERDATDRKKKSGDEQFVANTDAAKEARRAAELLTMSARDAQRAVRAMDGRSQLERAEKAERDHGKARKTVLAQIEKQLAG